MSAPTTPTRSTTPIAARPLPLAFIVITTGLGPTFLDGRLIIAPATVEPFDQFDGLYGRAKLVMQKDGNLVDYDDNGAAHLYMAPTGNLVVFDEHGNTRWSSNTYGYNSARFQTGGNLVVYSTAGPVWAAGTWGHPHNVQATQNDGNVVIYRPIWATGTNH
jgi:hypothetical protein